jgi:hypothetical protein
MMIDAIVIYRVIPIDPGKPQYKGHRSSVAIAITPDVDSVIQLGLLESARSILASFDWERTDGEDDD